MNTNEALLLLLFTRKLLAFGAVFRGGKEGRCWVDLLLTNIRVLLLIIAAARRGMLLASPCGFWVSESDCERKPYIQPAISTFSPLARQRKTLHRHRTPPFFLVLLFLLLLLCNMKKASKNTLHLQETLIKNADGKHVFNSPHSRTSLKAETQRDAGMKRKRLKREKRG